MTGPSAGPPGEGRADGGGKHQVGADGRDRMKEQFQLQFQPSLWEKARDLGPGLAALLGIWAVAVWLIVR